MNKSASTRWGSWSEWIWHEEYRRYYRQRQDSNGEVDYEWDPRSASSTAAVADEQTPRDSGMDELAQDFQDVNINSANYDPNSAEYSITSGASKHKSSKSASKSKSKSKSSSSRSKGKSHVYSDDEGEITEREAAAYGSSYQKSIPEERQQYVDPETGQIYEYPTTSAQAYTTGGAADYDDDDPRLAAEQPYGSQAYDEDPNLTAAIAESKNYNRSAHTAGESSSSAYVAYDYDDEGPPTPRAGTSSTHIAATGGDVEELDPRYRVEHSHKFQPGEIFKVLWCEPQGSANDGAPSVSDRHEYRDKFGGRLFVGFRRFIVIANDQGHCTCVPILTYGGKGCNKRGVKPEKHGIVYEKGHKPRLLSSEPKLGFAPVKIQITQDGEKLNKESRVNYSKLVTVEHNVKVLFIGHVMPSDWDIVSEAVNRCWEEKIHHKSRRQFR